MTMIRLVIFDFDGVLCPLNYEILEDVYRHIAIEMKAKIDWGDTLSAFREWFDPHYTRNLDRMGIGDPKDMLEAERLFREHLRSKGHNIYPEIVPILKKLNESFRLAIVSNGPELRARDQLRELCPLFGCILGRETIKEKLKPNPYGISLCLERLGIAPFEAVMIGDDVADILAAKNAGIKIKIGALWGMGSKEKLVESGANAVLERIENLQNIGDFLRI